MTSLQHARDGREILVWIQVKAAKLYLMRKKRSVAVLMAKGQFLTDRQKRLREISQCLMHNKIVSIDINFKKI